MVKIVTTVLIALVLGVVTIVIFMFFTAGQLGKSKEVITEVMGFVPSLKGEWFSCLANCLTHITKEEITPLNDTLLENEKSESALLTYYPCQYDILRFATAVSLTAEEKRDKNLLKTCYKGTFECSGTATNCGDDRLQSELCKSQKGCYWGGSHCVGSATPCNVLSETDCKNQEGCEWRVISSEGYYTTTDAVIDEYSGTSIDSTCSGKCFIKGMPLCNGTYSSLEGKQVNLITSDMCEPFEECDAADPSGWEKDSGKSLCFQKPDGTCYKYSGISASTAGATDKQVLITYAGNTVIRTYCMWNPHLKQCAGPAVNSEGGLILNYTDCEPYCPNGWYFDGLNCVREECVQTNQYREGLTLSCLENKDVKLFEGYNLKCSSRNFYDICNNVLYHVYVTYTDRDNLGAPLKGISNNPLIKITNIVINSSDSSTVNELDIENIKLEVTNAFGEVKASFNNDYSMLNTIPFSVPEGAAELTMPLTFPNDISYSLNLKSATIDGKTYTNINLISNLLNLMILNPVFEYEIRLPFESYLAPVQYFPCSGPESLLDLSYYNFKNPKYVKRNSTDMLNFVCESEAPYDACYSQPEKYGFNKCWPSWEVLINKTGDCQDYALLSNTLFRAVGKDVEDMLLLKGYCPGFLPCPCQALVDKCREKGKAVSIQTNYCNPSSRLIVNLRNSSTYFVDTCGRLDINKNTGSSYHVTVEGKSFDISTSFDINTKNIKGRTFDFFELRSPPNVLKESDIDNFCYTNGICFKDYNNICDSGLKVCKSDLDNNGKINFLGSETISGKAYVKTAELFCTSPEEDCETTEIKNPTLILFECVGKGIDIIGSSYLCGWQPGYFCYSNNTLSMDKIYSHDCKKQKDTVCDGWENVDVKELIKYCEPLVTGDITQFENLEGVCQ